MTLTRTWSNGDSAKFHMHITQTCRYLYIKVSLCVSYVYHTNMWIVIHKSLFLRVSPSLSSVYNCAPALLSVTCLIHTCDMTRLRMWHDSVTCMTWHIYKRDTTHSHVWHGSFMCVTCFVHMCDMTHSHVSHDAFICMTWLIHMCDMNRPYTWQQSPWALIRFDMTHSHVWHEAFTCVT